MSPNHCSSLVGTSGKNDDVRHRVVTAQSRLLIEVIGPYRLQRLGHVLYIVVYCLFCIPFAHAGQNSEDRNGGQARTDVDVGRN